MCQVLNANKLRQRRHRLAYVRTAVEGKSLKRRAMVLVFCTTPLCSPLRGGDEHAILAVLLLPHRDVCYKAAALMATELDSNRSCNAVRGLQCLQSALRRNTTRTVVH